MSSREPHGAIRSNVDALGRVLRREGAAGVVKRVARTVHSRVDAASLDFPIDPADLADSTRLLTPDPRTAVDIETARIGWICTPPGPGSGGHTTLFRMVAGLERLGHPCTLFLYDPKGGDVSRHEHTIRRHWPDMRADIRDARSAIDGVDAVVASSWETAHVLVSRSLSSAARLYFVQDFEPYFYPRGALYAFAEDSYRFGLRTIGLGHMVTSEIAALDVDVDFAPFGCDTSVYSLHNTGSRTGVVFYAKPGNDRRAFLLGQRALELFHESHPEQEIHVYGDRAAQWAFPVTSHDKLSPVQLNELYNATLGGFAMSFTNISLVAEEILAAGGIPVVNNSPLARADLSNREAVWAAPTPGALADALSSVVEHPDVPGRALRAAGDVRQGWEPAQAAVARTIHDELARARFELAPVRATRQDIRAYDEVGIGDGHDRSAG